MRTRIFTALVLAASVPAPTGVQAQTVVPAQTAPAIADLSVAMPVAGIWSWSLTATGSEANFFDATGRSQLTIRCTRANRRVSLSKPASAASASLSVWTSSQTRNLPATFQAAGDRLIADLAAFDGVLDAIAGSRGRFGVAAAGLVPLVVPSWPEVARVIEDCRV